MSRLTRDGTSKPVSRDQILRHAQGQGNIHFPCSADHEQDWQPYPVDPYSAICDDHTYIHTYSTDIHMTSFPMFNRIMYPLRIIFNIYLLHVLWSRRIMGCITAVWIISLFLNGTVWFRIYACFCKILRFVNGARL